MEGLIGITLTNYFRLMRENKFEIDQNYRCDSFILLAMATRNTLFQIRERQLFEEKYQKASILTPIFVLGHWRSGTTLLHTLLSLNREYAFPTQFQVSKPFVFLWREPIISRTLSLIPAEKRMMDNVQVQFDSPGEDESALAIGSLRSPYLGWSFPKRASFYDRYLSFKDTSNRDKVEWTKFFMFFLKKLSVRYGNQPLILKSPTHTARIEMILQIFPEAKFIHIHRNPYNVIRSSLKFYQEALPTYCLQSLNTKEFIPRIFRSYTNMYDAYFRDIPKLKDDQFIDIAYEDLEKNKTQTIGLIYEKLGLHNFTKFEPDLRKYEEENSMYIKNKYEILDDSLQNETRKQCSREISLWGYGK